MGFLAPWFLGAAAALGLPVYLHLLRKYKSRPVPFSSLMFFERRPQSSIRHRRLQHILLFSLRTALILLLVLAFARPAIRSSSVATIEGGRNLALCIDDSFSMRQGDRLDRARREALTVVNAMSAGDRAQVISFGGQTRLLTQMTADREGLRTAIAGIEPGDEAGSYAELTRSLRSVAQGVRNLEAHLFSDMQKSAMPASFNDLVLPPRTELKLHPVARQMLPNFTLETAITPRRVYEVKRVRLQATVAGFGTQAATRTVSLLINNKVMATKPVSLGAGGRGTAEFAGIDVPYGLNRGEFRIDSADPFPNDDRYYFSVERSDPRPALFVHEAGDTRSLVYYKTALESANEPAFSLDSVNAIDAGNQSPSRFAFVVLADTGPLPAGFEQALGSYVRNGGGLLVALGRNSRGRVPVAGLATTGPRYSAPEAERFLTPGWLDPSNPAMAQNTNWSGAKFYQTVGVDPGDATVLARYSDRSPLLLEKREGEGRVLVLTSGFDNIANDFPLNAAFVPFVEKSAQYLGGLGTEPTNFTTGAFLDLRSARNNAPVEVLGPDGGRAFSLGETTRTQSIELARQGFYEIHKTNGRRELAAANPDRRESDLDVVPAETLTLWQNTGHATPSETGVGDAAPQNRELWWYVLLLAVVLAVAESVIGNRYLVTRNQVQLRKEAA